MLLDSKYISEGVKAYLMTLYIVLMKVDLEQWYEKAKHIIDHGCYTNPTLWELAYEDFKKLKEVLGLCIRLKNCLEKSLFNPHTS